MAQWRFEIFNKQNITDVQGKSVLHDIRELGFDSVSEVKFARVFIIDGEFDQAFAQRIASELLSDTVCEEYCIGRRPSSGADSHIIEVHLKSGVTDPVARSVEAAIADMGVNVEMVRTARKYEIFGQFGDEQMELIQRRVLANDCIEDAVSGSQAEPPSPHTKPYEFRLTHIAIRGLDDDGLVKLSKDMDLFLDVKEMRQIQGYFKKLDREPTDIELETLAQTWSEHCVHKTLKSSVEFEYEGKKYHFDNLLKDTIFKATKQLDKPWCISVFADNAGVIEFDETDAICFKVETHNHPSALDPYGGAATGIGGVIRDPMGTGMGAKPIANTDVFCFGEPDKTLNEIPKGVLHPRRVMKGVVSGVRDYGNRMGIPTVNGAVYFDDRYIANPLVFCGNLGILPADKCFKKTSPGDLVVVVGGKTGRDGIHGATFSSGEMTHEHETVFAHAVQIGNAITEKKALDTLLQARDANLYDSITDCGAGGLSSAVGEMGEKVGVEVDLEKIPLKYAGLSYTEMWISEAQERMVLAVKPEKLEAIMKIFASEDVEATVIGTFKDDKKLTLKYNGNLVAQIDMEFLHDGVPKYTRKANYQKPKLSEPAIKEQSDYSGELLEILACYNVASKEWIIRQYDHEVQGGSVIKPLSGITNDGPSDAAVIRPKYDSDKGVALSCGMNPMYGDIDPYQMALSGIDEAIRNMVCVGARPDRIAVLDNFCWGNCTREQTFGSLVRAAQACQDAAMAYQTPFISGKDSLNNEFKCDDGTQISIPPTLLISAVGIVDDVKKCTTMDLKKAGNLLFIVGMTKNELGGSHYYKIKGQLGANVPTVDLELAPKIAARIHKAINAGLVASCHDCSEGGIAVSLAEMAFAGGLGVEANLAGLPASADCITNFAKLFSESNSRYVVEVKPENYNEFAKLMLNLPFGQIGEVVNNKNLIITAKDGSKLVNAEIEKLKQSWQSRFNW
jgi:phosphoribosylformylglycinamidine synthase